MSKRDREQDENGRPIKRSRLDAKPSIQPVTEDIYSARQLRQLLTFSQDGISDLRHGIASFKVFLERILYHSTDEGHDQRKGLLKEYLSSEQPRQGEEIEHPFLSQLWQAWSFANSSNNDHLSSAVCAIFALLLKTLSSSLDLTDQGVALCRTITQHQHLRHIKRCMDAPKHKEFLLSPSLRLLNELATFDGGVFVREMYKRREQTFDVTTLRKCLAITKAHDPADEEAWRKPAVRTLAVRYVLSHLKHQDEGAKADILRQRPLCTALFGYLKDDPSELVLDILRTAESHVFKDVELPRSAKAALLAEQHLHRVTELATGPVADDAVSTEALRWLKAVSSVSSYGVLRPCGWYPPGTAQIDMLKGYDPHAIDLGLDSVEAGADLEHQPLRNPVLASWIKTLRPHSDPRERDLVLTCFRAAPELVHTYFGSSVVQMEPKLTNTWMAYASFMFEVASLPAPANVGNIDSKSFAEIPPRFAIIMDSILPKPMTQKVLTRCLNQSSLLISFFAVRLLVVALTKVKAIHGESIRACSEATRPDLWREFSERLLATINSSIPKAKDVANLYRRLPVDEQHLLQREATARLLRLYHEVVPEAVAEETFDVSTFLLPALKNDFDVGSISYEWRSLELESLLDIAQHNTTMRWYQKQGGLPLSPIVSLLSMCSTSNNRQQIGSTAKTILEETGVLEVALGSQPPAFEALLSSLQTLDSSSVVWPLLDDYLARAAKSPVKYLDQLDAIRRRMSYVGDNCSILVAVLLEQAPFVVERKSKERNALMSWFNKFFAYAAQTSDGNAMLEDIRKQITQISKWPEERTDADPPLLTTTLSQAPAALVEEPRSIKTIIDGGLHFQRPSPEGTEHPELFRWQRKDLEVAIDDGDVDALLLCLSSEYPEVQRQARSQIDKLAHAVQSSTLDEKDQIFLVLGELLETFASMTQSEDRPLPHMLSTFAVRALRVQLDPTHLMYPKINRFLMKAPVWRAASISKYWLSITALSMPTIDDTYWEELQWVLDWLVNGLRTQQDLDLLRQASSLERLIAIHVASGPQQKQLKSRVLELIYRAAHIDATTLVTRTGMLSWLDTLSGSLPAALRKLIVEKCDTARGEAWAGIPLTVA